MSERKLQRGRPKGTGIDDAERLAAIAALLVENPEMKPTTAIKAIGITDPSAIRRLRDKLKAATKRKTSNNVRSQASKAGRTTKPLEVKPRTLTAANTNTASHDLASDWYQACLDLGLAAAKSAIEAQAIVTGNILRLPAVSVFVRQQFAISELAMSAFPGPAPTRGRHT